MTPTETAATTWTLPGRGRVGMACMILTESALFTIFVVAYLYYIGKSLSGPYPQDVLEMPVLATIALLSSSITITVAVRALRRGQAATFRLWWLATILLGGFFLVATAMEWNDLIYRHTQAYSGKEPGHAIPSGPPGFVKYGVTADEAHRFGLPCGGTLELLLEYDPDAAKLAELVAALVPGEDEVVGRAPRPARARHAVWKEGELAARAQGHAHLVHLR